MEQGQSMDIMPLLSQMTGYLLKLGVKNPLKRSWKKRFFRLRENKLFYYYTEKDNDKPINFILIDPNSIVTPVQGEQYHFQIKTMFTSRIYDLKAENVTDYLKWTDGLTSFISHTFLKDRAISNQKQFTKSADHKDTLAQRTIIDVTVGIVEFSSLENTQTTPSDQVEHLYFVISVGSEAVKSWKYKFNLPFSHSLTTILSSGFDGVNCTFSPNLESDKHITFEMYSVGTKIRRSDEVIARKQIPTSELQLTSGPSNFFLSYKSVLNSHSGQTFTTKLHFSLQKSFAFDKYAMLSERGTPAIALPLRFDTGDIILFNNSHVLSYGTKFFTRSQWDHVAIVIRWYNGELRLLESTSDVGVAVYKFDKRLQFLKTVSKVGVRRLNYKRTPEMMDGMYRLLDEMLGRPFEKDMMKLVRAAGGVRNNEQDLSSVFCSELAAEAYKRMGVFKDDGKKTNNYLPKNWASKTNKDLPLISEANLERKLIFRKKKESEAKRSSSRP